MQLQTHGAYLFFMETTTVKVNPILQRLESLDKAVRHELRVHAHEYNGRLIPKQEVEPDEDYDYADKIIYIGSSISSDMSPMSALQILKMTRITQKEFAKQIYDSLGQIIGDNK
jgi:hypothetical protein